MAIQFIHARQLVLEPKRGTPWADEMVLNPGIIQDPHTGRIHMFFRATGPWPQKKISGQPLPYPAFLGYAYSEDLGRTWKADFSRPALAPALNYEMDKLTIADAAGAQMLNHANGCLEDPRLFFLEGRCYLICACRLMPTGPYWVHDDPTQCAPAWVKTQANPYGRAASENAMVSVLFQVDLARLAKKDYAKTFAYVGPLTDPQLGDDRNTVLFPEKLTINGRRQYVSLHRPSVPKNFPGIKADLPPSMFICASDTLLGLGHEMASQTLLAYPIFPWERNRLGASAPPLRISEREWLLCYHGKQDAKVGTSQSFMILEEQVQGFPRITHRSSERVMFAQEAWELPNKFETPCVFISGLIRLGDELLASYGAADERVGVARLDYQPLLDFVRSFSAGGKQL